MTITKLRKVRFSIRILDMFQKDVGTGCKYWITEVIELDNIVLDKFYCSMGPSCLIQTHHSPRLSVTTWNSGGTMGWRPHRQWGDVVNIGNVGGTMLEFVLDTNVLSYYVFSLCNIQNHCILHWQRPSSFWQTDRECSDTHLFEGCYFYPHESGSDWSFKLTWG